jgi:hypothetical protein
MVRECALPQAIVVHSDRLAVITRQAAAERGISDRDNTPEFMV